LDMKPHRLIELGSIFVAMSLVGISCSDNLAPEIVFISPQKDFTVVHDTSLLIAVQAEDRDGRIQIIDFLFDDKLLTRLADTPYQYFWQSLKIGQSGKHVLKAIAEDEDGERSSVRINVNVQDFRMVYYGRYRFMVVTENWQLGQPYRYDTSYHNGFVRAFKKEDLDTDLYPNDDSQENVNDKISIEFIANGLITTLLNLDGSFVMKSGYHYGHSGHFQDEDHVEFYVGGFGGLGGGYNYRIVGEKL